VVRDVLAWVFFVAAAGFFLWAVVSTVRVVARVRRRERQALAELLDSDELSDEVKDDLRRARDSRSRW